MKNFILPFLFCASLFVFGQGMPATPGGTLSEYNLHTISADLKMNKFNEINTRKDEYFDTDFRNASISGYKEKEKLRYNAFLDDFEYIRDGYLYKMNRMSNQIIVFDNTKIFKLVNFIENDKLTSRYLQVLSSPEDKIVLYKKYAIDYTDGLGASGLNASNKKNYFKQDKLMLGFDDKLFNIPSSVKKIGNLIGKDVESIVKSNNLNVKKESDLIKLVEIINK
ncbi:hypothetical protein [Empedobacter tilapiae]|uniref:GLPGLI family protein n=1 Tax=Empedobacter tilapiae TaxID=2491114 RepID=A0A4Z1BFB5_9FLAO|nr:hypothetical protein [Empedobacter tilapiae]TGN23729.1 hypothetical protein E4J94_14860 [Empedobacter tilapiae]